MNLQRLLILALPAMFAAPLLAQSETLSRHDRALAAGYKAAFLCSGLFNAGITERQVADDDLSRIYPGYRPVIDALDATVDRAAKSVSVAFSDDLPPRIAIWRPHLGCAQLPIGADPAAQNPLPRLAEDVAAPDRAATDALDWPQGDADANAPLAPPVRSALDAVIAAGFDSESYGAETKTTAVLVLRDGRIVGERYRADYDRHTPQRTWSVAKSIAASVIGVAAGQGMIDIDGPAPVSAWQTTGDPRRAIGWHDLLHMSSGLWSPFAGNRTDDIYFGGMAVTDSIPGLPLEAAPGTRWRYANNDTMLAALALRTAIGDDARALAFPFTDLLWKIGMTRTYPETDWQGNFVFSSQVWTTARDLGRLGLLYLNDGVWNGEQILPQGWAAYVATPASDQPEGRDGVGYGAQFWLFGPGQGLPEGSYAAMGNRGQYVMIVPEQNIVVVRRGFDPVGEDVRFDIARFSADILVALGR